MSAVISNQNNQGLVRWAGTYLVTHTEDPVPNAPPVFDNLCPRPLNSSYPMNDDPYVHITPELHIQFTDTNFPIQAVTVFPGLLDCVGNGRYQHCARNWYDFTKDVNGAVGQTCGLFSRLRRAAKKSDVRVSSL
ncbi:hypothetical protein MMC06_006006 [Schaereria dolodes]|nr:hypothetical protein [Schaereria dolodes]